MGRRGEIQVYAWEPSGQGVDVGGGGGKRKVVRDERRLVRRVK